ncbi:MAG: helix-turn-helix domain-containing protein, partial [Bacteroidota bacterium]|nr:helix-turn-helix domain-containing protein [Bacteroidota bacterium]
LAWAITIHKSQGLTFEKAIIDANAAFAHGQVYVALSRCKTLDGIILNTPISTGCIKTDHTVSAFTHEAEQNQPDQELLARSKQAFQQKLHAELFDFTVLGRRMQYLIKILNEHKASFLDSYRESFDNMSDLLKSDLLSVANKFAVQIKQLSDDQISIEENVTLQERTRKGCAYFLEKTNALMHLVLKNTPVETDNKVVRKSVNDALEKLRQEANIKLSCLKTCLKGFIVMEYLDARAKATIEKPEIRKPALKKEDYAAISNIHPQLYKRLRKWRNSKAEEANLPEYMIMPQKTLMELVKRLPESRYELQNVKGFGKSKTLQFGTEVLEIVKTYMIDNHIGSSNGIPEPSDANESVAPDDTIEQEEGTSKPKAEIKKKKADTKLLSFDLFKSGATVEEIARERGLTVSTIDGHLSHYVRTGELEIGMVVPQEKIALITEYYINNPNSGMTAAKESLDETISYSDIRYVLKHLEHLKQGDAELPE